MTWNEIESLKNDGETAQGNWEESTRPITMSHEGEQEQAWTPVYIQLVGDLEKAAGLLLELHDDNKSNLLRLSDDSFTALMRLRVPQSSGLEGTEQFIFIYRPRGQAGIVLTDKSEAATPLYEVIRFGPAIPLAFSKENFVEPSADKVTRSLVGKIVVTGIIDDAIGVVNERLCNQGGTRVEQLWRQFTESFDAQGGNQFVFGLEKNADQINDMFQNDAKTDEDQFYRLLEEETRSNAAPGAADIPSIRQSIRRRASHGTFVADLAAGQHWHDTTLRPILAVELPTVATAETWGARLEMYILMAVLRMIFWADNRIEDEDKARAPLVINLSFTMSSGPRDGTSFLEREIDRHVTARNDAGVPTYVVYAAGNDHRNRRRAVVDLVPQETRSVDWMIAPADQMPSFLEIRLPPDADAEIAITPPSSPDGRAVMRLKTINDHKMDKVLEVNNMTIARVYLQDEERSATSGHHKGYLLTIALAPTLNWNHGSARATPGAWRISVENRSSTANLRATADVQRDESPSGFPGLSVPSYLEDEWSYDLDPERCDYSQPDPIKSVVTRKGTLSSLATRSSPYAISVGGAVDLNPAGYAPLPERHAALYTASAEGLPIGEPTISAISEQGYGTPGILGAGTFSGSAYASNGTSVAAPQVTRAIVDFLQDQLNDHSVPDHSEVHAYLHGIANPVVSGGLRPRLSERTIPFFQDRAFHRRRNAN